MVSLPYVLTLLFISTWKSAHIWKYFHGLKNSNQSLMYTSVHTRTSIISGLDCILWLYSLHLTLHYSTLAPLQSTWVNTALLWLYFTLLHSTSLHTVLPWFYFTLLDSILVYIGSTSLYFPPHNSQCMALLYSTWFYITLHWLYITPLHSN